jgi:hypothetical protein
MIKIVQNFAENFKFCEQTIAEFKKLQKVDFEWSEYIQQYEGLIRNKLKNEKWVFDVIDPEMSELELSAEDIKSDPNSNFIKLQNFSSEEYSDDKDDFQDLICWANFHDCDGEVFESKRKWEGTDIAFEDHKLSCGRDWVVGYWFQIREEILHFAIGAKSSESDLFLGFVFKKKKVKMGKYTENPFRLLVGELVLF